MGKATRSRDAFIERLWRSVKHVPAEIFSLGYEEVYAKNYESVRDAIEGLARYFQHTTHFCVLTTGEGFRIWDRKEFLWTHKTKDNQHMKMK